MIALHNREHRLRDRRELEQAGRRAFRFEREHSDGRRRHIFAVKYLKELVLRQAGRGVEEVEDLQEAFKWVFFGRQNQRKSFEIQ